MPQVGELVQREPKAVAKNRWLRLFNKNTALGKHESGRIGLPIVTGKQVNIPVPMCSAMWGRRRLAQPTVGHVGSSL